jgi:hypothetical protein
MYQIHALRQLNLDWHVVSARFHPVTVNKYRATQIELIQIKLRAADGNIDPRRLELRLILGITNG